MEIGTTRLRYLSHPEVEMLLGYQANHTGVLVHEEAASLNSLMYATDTDSVYFCNIPS